MSDWYRFTVMGPYRVPVVRGKREIDCLQARDNVFEQAKSDAKRIKIPDITKAIGCYVFALCPSGRSRPWPYYVGQSCRQTLYERVFQETDKKALYNGIMDEYDRARPLMFLLPLLTPEKRLARVNSNRRMIDHAEIMLIGMALNANFDLWNIKHRTVLDSFAIDGTPHSGAPRSNAARAFKDMLDLHGA